MGCCCPVLSSKGVGKHRGREGLGLGRWAFLGRAPKGVGRELCAFSLETKWTSRKGSHKSRDFLQLCSLEISSQVSGAVCFHVCRPHFLRNSLKLKVLRECRDDTLMTGQLVLEETEAGVVLRAVLLTFFPPPLQLHMQTCTYPVLTVWVCDWGKLLVPGNTLLGSKACS